MPSAPLDVLVQVKQAVELAVDNDLPPAMIVGMWDNACSRAGKPDKRFFKEDRT